MHVEVQVLSKCLRRDGSEKTTNQFLQVLELNTMEFNLHLLVLGGGNNFEVPRHCRDESHDECEVVVRSIVEVHG